MSVLQFTVSDVSLTSYWYVRERTIDHGGGIIETEQYTTTPNVVTARRTFSLTGLPAGSIIHSASLDAVRSGPAGSDRQMDGSRDTGALPIAASRITPGGSLEIEFLFKAAASFGAVGYHSQTAVWSEITLTVDYTGYTACTAPTSVSLSKNTALPSESLTLSWSGAQAGLNNAISKYEVYRAASASGTYTKLAETNASTRTLTVAAPAAAGSYHYKVKAIGAVSGYSSGLSTASASVSVSVTAPGKPTGLSVSPAAQYPTGAATLSWTAPAAGTNNPITGYKVYSSNKADGAYTFLQNASGTSCTVHAPQSGSAYFKVMAVGTYLDGALSTASASLAVDMSGTSDVTFSPAVVDAGAPLTVAFTSNTGKAHTLVFSIGNYSQTVQSAAGAASAVFTPPLTWLNAMKTSETGTLTVKITTAGAGTITRTATLRCPDSVKPTGVNGSAAPYSNTVPAAWGVYAAGLSAATVTLDTAATAPYGASIVNYKITGPGIHVEGDTLPLAATSSLLSKGSKTYTLSAIDSRGRVGTKTITLTVLPYAAPTLKNILSRRTDSQGEEEDEGTWVLAEAAIVCSALDGHNTASCAVAYRRQGVSAWSSAGSLSNGSRLFGSGNISLPYNWELRYTVTDSLGKSTVYYDVVTRAVWEIHVKKGGGAWAFGGVADQDGTLKVYGQVAAALGNVPAAVCDIDGDLNNAVLPGLYMYLSSHDHRPTSTGGALLVVRYNQNMFTQLAFCNSQSSSVLVYARHYYQGTWGAWVKLTTAADYPYKRTNLINTTAAVATTNAWTDTGLTVDLEAGHLYAISVSVGSGGGVFGVQLRAGGTINFEHEVGSGQSMANLSPVFYCNNANTYQLWVKRAGTGSASYRITDIGNTQA